MRTYPDTGIPAIGAINEQVLSDYNIYWEPQSLRAAGFSTSISLVL